MFILSCYLQLKPIFQEKVILSLPKFKIESTVNLKEIIEKLGKFRLFCILL